MSATGKIRISMFLLGILICLLAESVNGQEGEGEEEGERRQGSRGREGGRGGERGRGGEGGRGREEGRGRRYPGHNYDGKRKFNFRDIFEKSSDPELRDFCNGKACPKFTDVNNNEVFQLRNYEETKWLFVETPGSFREQFFALANYLRGNNTENKKLQIGIPVLKEFVQGNDQPRRMFYTSEPNPPPADNIEVITIPQTNIYVRSFGGYANNDTIEANRQLLIENIGSGYETANYYVAVFNSPFQKTGRHNEIWIIARN